MSTATPLPTEPLLLADLTGTHRFTVDEYHRMLSAGAVVEGEPVELLEGYIVHKLDRGPDREGDIIFPRWSALRKFSVGEYHKLIAAGILTPDDRVELLEGYVVTKMPQNSPHSGTLDRLAEDVGRLSPAGWRARTQLPVTLSRSEPEPDVAVVRGGRRTFDARQPGPADIGALMEVSDSSARTDRGPKAHVYAADAIPVYWVVNVADRRVEVYTDPDPAADPPAYRTRTDYTPGQAVPLVLDGVAVGTVPVADLLP